MRRVTITRSDKLPQMFGVLTVGLLRLFTVERPWVGNQNNVSCIPVGVYIVKWTKSPRLKRYTYEVRNVPKRSGIRIHSANFPKQVLGCLSLGMSRGSMDGQVGVFSSVTAVRKFEQYMNHETFELEIKYA